MCLSSILLNIDRSREHDHCNSFLKYTIRLQVIALDVDLPVKQAFHILHEQVILFSFELIYYRFYLEYWIHT